MRSKVRILIAALIGVSMFSIAASAYAIRARGSAIRGWAAASKSYQPEFSTTSAATYRSLWGVVIGEPDVSDDLSFAKKIAEYIHRHVAIGRDDTKGTWPARMSRALLNKGEKALCGDYSVFLKTALDASGIPARTVQLAAQSYVDGERVGDTHVTVEVLIANKWVVVDPTFNATFSCGDDPALLGIAQMKKCGDSLTIHQGSGTLPDRGVKDYYLPFGQLAQYYMRAKTRVAGTLIDADGSPNRDWLVKTRSLYRKSTK